MWFGAALGRSGREVFSSLTLGRFLVEETKHLLLWL